jgi:hypothetical protein
VLITSASTSRNIDNSCILGKNIIIIIVYLDTDQTTLLYDIESPGLQLLHLSTKQLAAHDTVHTCFPTRIYSSSTAISS